MLFGFELTELIQILGYPGIFAVILAESGLFFAASLPGGSLLFTAGLLASQGFLDYWLLLSIVVVAAILGDTIGYWFGAWVGPALWRRPDSRFFKKAYLEQTKHFFDTHGPKAILLARFIPIIRTFAPILAGVAQMHYRTFLTYNAIGAVVWGGGFVTAGYMLGTSVPDIEDYLEYIVLAIILVTLIPFFLSLRQAGMSAPPRPRAILFDLDDTLADSFTPPTDRILAKLATLARSVPVAIVSGAAHQRVRDDVLARTSLDKPQGMYALTDSAARAFGWFGEWREMYAFPIGPADASIITAAVKRAVQESGVFADATDTSEVKVRETSVAFHALPKEASQLEKRAWDSSTMKRTKIATILKRLLPEYEIAVAGKTTIDITRKGINKAYGIEWLAKELGISPKEMLFIGDSFFTGGNDAIVIPTGIQTLETKGPQETERIIDDLISTL